MTTALVLLGVCCGVGLVLTAAGVTRRPAALADETGKPRQSRHHDQLVGGRRPLDLLASVGSTLDRYGSSRERAARRAPDLAITGRTLERHCAVLATSVLLGAVTPLALGGLLHVIGWHLPVLGLLVTSALGAAGGAASTAAELRRSANTARTMFLRALSCWLELVALAQAGGMGMESALEGASRVSPDPNFRRIHQALERSRHSGVPPWGELERLGAEIGIGELDELAAHLGLAGSEGARVRASLQAKSESLRRRQTSEAESYANSVTERLFVPSILLMVGFLVFIMFPAAISLARVL
ncbi:MAG: type II secretion system F family protein [Acidimicrobiales bacterium]|jgi:Flp pilus assembly protein TadB